jgi:hypothetical protein
MAMRAAKTIGTAFRIERSLGFCQCRPKPYQQIFQDMIAADNKEILPDLAWGVPIADMPRNFSKVLMAYFNHWLGRSLDNNLAAIIQQEGITRTKRNRFGKIHHKSHSAISGHSFTTQKPRFKFQGDRHITITAGYTAVDMTGI